MSIEYKTWLATAAEELSLAGVISAAVDAELLLAHVCQLSRADLVFAAITGKTIDSEQLPVANELLARRLRREPLQHILGLAPFRLLEFQVGPGVFVPRAETEILVQLVLDALAVRVEPEATVIDFGTGSGAIAASIAKEFPRAEVIAVEKSSEAIKWTAANFDRFQLPNLRLIQGDLAEVPTGLDGQVSIVVSNPPYIPDAAIPRDLEVQMYDPPLALYGGEDGLDLVRVLSRRALDLLMPGGNFFLEHGEQQGFAIRKILSEDGWRTPATHPDLTLRDRFTSAVRP